MLAQLIRNIHRNIIEIKALRNFPTDDVIFFAFFIVTSFITLHELYIVFY